MNSKFLIINEGQTGKPGMNIYLEEVVGNGGMSDKPTLMAENILFLVTFL